MKKCSECGKSGPIYSGFCVICGARLDMPANSRRERLLFFLMPVFFIILGIAFATEIGMQNPLESGMHAGGMLAVVYLLAGAVFWILTKTFKLPALPDSYWQAGVLTVIHLIVCILFTYNIEIFIFGSVIKNMGPLEYNQIRASILALVFLPTLFTGILAVSARARAVTAGHTISNRLQLFLFKNTVVLIPVIVLLASGVIWLSQPDETKSLIQARMLLEVDAATKATKVMESALTKNMDSAPLHYLMGTAIIESMPADYTIDNAISHLQKAVSLVPDNAIYLYQISVANDFDHNLKEAVNYASAAVELQKGDAFLWQHLGELQLKSQNYDASILAYSRALELEPDNPTLLNNLAFACLEINKNLPQALEMARKSVENLPDFIFNTDTLAWAYYKNNMFAQALDVMNSIYSERTRITAEVDFHYAMILHANQALHDPVKSLEQLLARPEVAMNPTLAQQILTEKLKIVKNISHAEKRGN